MKKTHILNNGFKIVNGDYVFAPWNSDVSFRELYSKIKDYTLLGEIKSYFLWKMVKESTKLNGMKGHFLKSVYGEEVQVY
jgi:hypothetical protein